VRELLCESGVPVVTCEIARLEVTSAVAAAQRARRIRNGDRILNRFDAECGEGGTITLLRLRPEVVLPTARDLVRRYPLYALDALHLAVAMTEAPALGSEPVELVTRDARQAAAAADLGLAVR
jgi:predicted nucleic acid-binding protein